jgi:hypothetical protein
MKLTKNNQLKVKKKKKLSNKIKKSVTHQKCESRVAKI